MSTPRTPRDIVLELIRQQLDAPELSYEQALENPIAKSLFDAFEQMADVSARATQPRERKLAGYERVSGVINAAINDTFVLDELDVEPHIVDALLAASHLVMMSGVRRLRLQDAERAGVLTALKGDAAYLSLLKDAVESDKRRHDQIGKSAIELPSAWLRCFLSGDFRDLDTAPPAELKAALSARERLRLVTDLPASVPSIADLSRQVDLAELLDPLRILIGADGGWDGRKRRDRFVGREAELRRLREFVDELSSQSAGEFVSRFSRSVVNALTGSEPPGIMIITARGGLGKSTLLAKFVLDHALDQEQPFPFAYLDFDRAGIDPERPQQLLIEIVRQVALQFPDAHQALQRLADDIRAAQVSPSPKTEFANLNEISDPFARFVEILRDQITLGKRAFLMVFDTLEIVQWNANAVKKLAEIVDEFRRKGLSELRLVVSGRADVPELRWARGSSRPADAFELKPLLVREARILANELGKASLRSEWEPAWATAIAGTASDSDVRREPLAVRVATDLIVRTEKSKRAAVASEIRAAGINAADDFIARLYEKRILNHVRDDRAKRLAWPGLVVRRLTSEIVRELLAPYCGISPEEADGAFLALGQEIWMVTREDAAGTVLRHRPDLRARTLPLMRNRDLKQFNLINRDAINYFGRHRNRSLEDFGEWIYHRMLGDESIGSIQGDVTDEVLPMLVRAEADFSPDSAAASYLTSRTADERLSPKRIRGLQPIDALRHLSATSSGTFSLDDNDIDRVAIDVSERLQPAAVKSDPLEVWAQGLWIKVGALNKIDRDLSFDGLPTQLLRLHLFWAARSAYTLDEEQRAALLDRCVGAVGNGERVGFRSTVQAMALARFQSVTAFNELDANVTRILLSMRPNSLPSTQAALRTAIVLGKECRRPALDLWVTSRRRGTSDRIRTPTFSRKELEALVALHPAAANLFGPALDPRRPTRLTDDRTIASAASVLSELIGDARSTTLDELSKLFGTRREDWIVPVGYAAARARAGIPPILTQRLTSYSGDGALPTDMLGACRMADEAGDLSAFLEIVSENSSHLELEQMIEKYRAWSRAIDAVLSDGVPGAGSVKVDIDSPPASRLTLSPPPAPPPGPHEDDPQKDRWGSQAERDGRALRATLTSVEKDIFYFSLVVESVDGSRLEAPVIFHLHDSYPQDVVPVTRITDGRQASIRDLDAYGVYAVGVQVQDLNGRWTSLEFDLATLPRLPKRFLER